MGEINFKNVDIEGLESSPFAKELADLRANEARYYCGITLRQNLLRFRHLNDQTLFK